MYIHVELLPIVGTPTTIHKQYTNHVNCHEPATKVKGKRERVI